MRVRNGSGTVFGPVADVEAGLIAAPLPILSWLQTDFGPGAVSSQLKGPFGPFLLV